MSPLRALILLAGLALIAQPALGRQAPSGAVNAQSDGPLPARPFDPDRRENILIILADDLGIDSVGAYGVGIDRPSTPVLDALAASGVMFWNAWSNPICSPTRATIQTGRYCVRTGIGGIVYSDTGALSLSETILPEALDLGTGGAYAHAAFGKWHLGNGSVGGRCSPNFAGYSHFSGVLGNLQGANDYFHWTKIEDGARIPIDHYATSENVDDVLAWVDSVPEPWFCYLAYNAPHNPWHIPPDELHSIDFSQADTNRMRYKAAVEALDTETGRLLEGLGPALAHTTVIFLGDNGTPELALPEGAPNWQSKWYLYQGGVRVPLIVTGPRVAAPGSECHALVNTTDLFPTVLELAGAEIPPSEPRPWERDSVSILPYLANPALPSMREVTYAEVFKEIGFGPFVYIALAITDGEYKLIMSDSFWRHDAREFYYMPNDPLEVNNLLDAPLSPEAEARLNWLKSQVKAIRQ